MKTILLADDDPLLIELLRHKLSLAGFEVESCGDGQSAFDLAGKLQPDLIILDAMMPAMDGFQVLRKLGDAKRTASIPVIMLTARKQEHDILEGLSLGAVDYLIKPFSPDELVMRIKKVLNDRPSNIKKGGARQAPQPATG